MFPSRADASLSVVGHALGLCDGDGMEAASVIARALLVCVKALGLRLRLDVVPGHDADENLLN